MNFLTPYTSSRHIADRIAASIRMDGHLIPGYPNYKNSGGKFGNAIDADGVTQSTLRHIPDDDVLLHPLKHLSPSRLTYCLANILFQPTIRIQNQLKLYLRRLTFHSGCLFIALQIRKGGSQKRFQDNEARISDQGDKMLIQCARVLEAKLLEKHKTELDVSSHQTGNKGLQIKFFLSTDDEDLANELSNDLTLRDQFIIVPGSVAHIDQTLNISYAEMEKVVLPGPLAHQLCRPCNNLTGSFR